MSHYSFEFPYVFLLLPLLWFCQKKCPAKNEAIYFPFIHYFFKSEKIKNFAIDFFKWAAIILILIALASPVKITTIHTQKNARDIMLILDSSESMLEKGFDDKVILKNKFDAVKEVLKTFISKRKEDKIGLIVFANSAYIASPLTFNNEYLQTILQKQKVGIVGTKTAIYDSLLRAIYLLNNNNAKHKIAILLTDGKDNMSQTKYSDIINVIKKTQTKLYVIGIGNSSNIDIEKLKSLAQAGDGKFYRATDKKKLKKIYEDINKHEYSKKNKKTIHMYTYYYFFPLLGAILFLLLFVYYKSVKGIS